MDTTLSYWPLIVLLLGTVSVVFFIVVCRLHAFIALILAAIMVGILGQQAPETANAWVAAVENTMQEFGITAGKVSFVIAIASVLGIALTESGAAERIVNQLVDIFGEKRAGIALLVAGFILSIPVFFDTVFFLMIPLGIALARKTGKDFILFVLAISGGAVITHSLVPPTPGPLVMAETLNLNLGLVIVAGILSGIIPTIVGYKFAQALNRSMPIAPPVFDQEVMHKQSGVLPSFFLSLMPILLPLLLIIAASVVNILFPRADTAFLKAVVFLGNKNIAMFLGLLVAMYLWAKSKGLGLKELGLKMERPLELAGLIILITAAGGAFGAMIRNTGLGEMIQEMAANGFSINLVVIAWLLAAVMKFAQGSSTVSVITTAGIMAALIPSANELGYHPLYIYLAIGYGAMVGSWMNDSGFWIVGKLSGMNERETLRSWTVLLVVLGVVGGIQVLLASYLLPLI